MALNCNQAHKKKSCREAAPADLKAPPSPHPAPSARQPPHQPHAQTAGLLGHHHAPIPLAPVRVADPARHFSGELRTFRVQPTLNHDLHGDVAGRQGLAVRPPQDVQYPARVLAIAGPIGFWTVLLGPDQLRHFIRGKQRQACVDML